MDQRFSRARDRVPGAWRAALATFVVTGVMAAWGPAAARAPGGRRGAGAVQGTVGAKTAPVKAGNNAAATHDSRAGDDASGDLSTFLTTSGHGGYVSAGVAMRNQGSGTISIAGIPAGATVKSATLLWTVLDDSASAADASGELDGHAITGSEVGTGPTPCWDEVDANFSFAADVTSLVTGKDADYALSGFSSGDTNGQDPWSAGSDAPLLEGASLVIIYADAALPLSTFQIATGGAETDSGNSADATHSTGSPVGPAATVTTTFIVADGQDDGNTAAVNDDTLDDVSFSGDSPQSAPPFTYGDLWDNETANITDEVKKGDTSVDMSVTGEGDCLVWVGQVLDVAGATVLGLGDSITAGYGIGRPAGTTPRPKPVTTRRPTRTRWPRSLAARPRMSRSKAPAPTTRKSSAGALTDIRTATSMTRARFRRSSATSGRTRRGSSRPW